MARRNIQMKKLNEAMKQLDVDDAVALELSSMEWNRLKELARNHSIQVHQRKRSAIEQDLQKVLQ